MRFRNATTGVTVSASDEVGARLSADWEPVDVEKPRRGRKPTVESEDN